MTTTPLFFGEASRQLFGVYHAPSGGAADHAVLLCAAGPQEYMLTHWAQRRLAGMLAKQGLHVLRFDYFGTGDSAGSLDEGTLETWQGDIRTAEQRLHELSGAVRTSLVGHRLGAALAWRASRDLERRPRHLVLWDPVVCGRSYMRELCVAEATFASQLLYSPPREHPSRELFGYPVSEQQRVSTEALDLLKEPLPLATRMHLYVGLESGETRALSARLTEHFKRYSFEYVPEEGRAGSGNLLSKRVLDAIRGALSTEAG